jgi:hypothetical protein
MAKKMTFKGVARRSVRGWGAVLAGGLLMTALAMLDAPREGVASTADGSTGCQLQVVAPEVKVRSGPSNATEAVETLKQGTIVDGTTVVTDGYRQLEDDRWVANEYLVPVTGSSC